VAEVFVVVFRKSLHFRGEDALPPSRPSFEAAQALRPDDAPCRTFIERCQLLARDGLPEGWDGAWHFDRK